MNKEKFVVVRDNWNSLAPKIGHEIPKLKMKVREVARNTFGEMECARDTTGKVCFMNILDKKYVPNFFYEIGTKDYLNHIEMERLGDILPRFMNY